MPSKWIDHVKSYAAKHKMGYRDALKDPKCKENYQSVKGTGPTQSRVAPAPPVSANLIRRKKLDRVDGSGLRAIARKMHGKGTCGGKIKGGALTRNSLASRINSLLSTAVRIRDDNKPVVEPYDEYDDDWGQLFHFVSFEAQMLLDDLQNANKDELLRIQSDLGVTVRAIRRILNAIDPDEQMSDREEIDDFDLEDMEGGKMKISGKGPTEPENISHRASILINMRNSLGNIAFNLERMERDAIAISLDDIVQADMRYADIEDNLSAIDTLPENLFLQAVRTVVGFINRMRQRYGNDIIDVIEGGKINRPLDRLLHNQEMRRRFRAGDVPNITLPQNTGLTQEEIMEQIRQTQRRERARESRETFSMSLEDVNALTPISAESIREQMDRLQSMLNLLQNYSNRQTGGKINDSSGGAIKDFVSPASWKDYATAVVKGRNDYPPKMREIIQKYGDKPIMRMQSCRTPLSSFMTTALNIASLGEFNKRFNNMPHDKLFHLDLRVEIADDTGKRKQLTTILLEKTEVLNADVNPKKQKDTECSLIQNFPRPLTINKLLEGAKKIQGDKFFKYSANNNNCQDFIMALLKGSNAGNQQNYEFVKQDTQELFKGLPFFRKLTNTVTDIGAAANTLMEGKSIKGGMITEGNYELLKNLFITIAALGTAGFLYNRAQHIIEQLRNQRVAPQDIQIIQDVIVDVLDRAENGEVINPDELLTQARLAGLGERTDLRRIGSMDFSVSTVPAEEIIPAEAVPIVTPRPTGGKIQKGMDYYVQSIVFDKSKFNKKSASDWIKKHNYENKGVDEKEDTLRFRQVDPDYIEEKGFNRFRTKKIGRNSGVSLIIAYK